MNKKLLFLFLFFSPTYLFCQNNQATGGKMLWKINPFDHKVFIENRGQFNGDLPNNASVLFEASFGKIKACFTPSGITYRFDSITGGPGQEDDENPKAKTPPVHTPYYMSMLWVGANANVTIGTGGNQTYYYTYPEGRTNTITANVYKTITYSNLYPGIDAVYSFPDQGGIKYALIVHPGADISQVKLLCTGANNTSINLNGDILLSTSSMGTFTDHAPLTYYQDDAMNTIASSYNFSANIESFSVASYDNTKTIIIDPWTNNAPGFTSYNDAFDIDYDNTGNVYVYGSAAPFQLIKLNSAGTVQWVYNSAAVGYGDIAVDKVSGETYITDGWIYPSASAAWKIKTTGALMGTMIENTLFDEFWRAVWVPGTRQVIVAGGGAASDQMMMLDTNMGLVQNPQNPLGSASCCNDMPMLCLDPSGPNAFGATGKSVASALFANVYIKVPVPALTPSAFQVNDGFAFQELSTPYYYKGGVEKFGYNGLTASCNWAYFSNGDTLRRMNKSTGAISAVVKVHQGKPYRWGGIDADHCDNIYMGVMDSIAIFNNSLVRTNSIYMGANTDTVYDLELGINYSPIYVCGNGFVEAITNPVVCGSVGPCSVLPIDLQSFTCQPENGGIELNWSTATETNNKFFTIERSTDGITFQSLANINGAGNSSTQHNYSYLDKPAVSGTYYYRLNQTDFDGHSQSFNITSCSETVVAEIGKVYPNPNSGKFTVTIDNTVATIQIYNAIGQKVYNKSLVQNAGNTLEVDLSSQAPGIYIMNLLTSSGQSIVRRINVLP